MEQAILEGNYQLPYDVDPTKNLLLEESAIIYAKWLDPHMLLQKTSCVNDRDQIK